MSMIRQKYPPSISNEVVVSRLHYIGILSMGLIALTWGVLVLAPKIHGIWAVLHASI